MLIGHIIADNVLASDDKIVCRFEDDKDISTLYEELWDEISSSERVTLQLYLGETISLICECISSSSWASKRKVLPILPAFLFF